MSQRSKSTRFWEIVCSGILIWKLLFGMSIAFLSFMALSLYVADPDSGTFVIITINVVLLSLMLVLFGGTIRKCQSGDF